MRGLLITQLIKVGGHQPWVAVVPSPALENVMDDYADQPLQRTIPRHLLWNAVPEPTPCICAAVQHHRHSNTLLVCTQPTRSAKAQSVHGENVKRNTSEKKRSINYHRAQQQPQLLPSVKKCTYTQRSWASPHPCMHIVTEHSSSHNCIPHS